MACPPSHLVCHDAPPLVTVIVPTIGRPEYIVDTIRSILAQSYSNLQVLVSDNDPETATARLLADAGIFDPRIELVTRPRRLGFSEHMNTCITDARGVYVMILSDDDQITPGYLQEMVELMASQQDVTVCLGRQTKITEHDSGMILHTGVESRQSTIDGVSFLKGWLSGNLQTDVMTYISMFARTVDILEAGGFRDYPDGSHADNFIFFNLALRGRVGLISSTMFYRVYVTSFGLRTPFDALMGATKAYTRDCARLLSVTPDVAVTDKRAILRALKVNNVQMLLGRLRHVYRHRQSTVSLIKSLLEVARFRLSRTESL